MIWKGLGYFVIAVLLLLTAGTAYLYYQNERAGVAPTANLQPEISPPPPDEMWARGGQPQPGASPRRRGMQMMPPPNASPTPTPTPTDRSARIDSLLRDRDQFQRQIAGLAPDQIDADINARTQELQQLQTQLQQYQNTLQNLDRQTSQTVQFQSVLQQTRVADVEDRIRVQERLIQSTKEQEARVALNPVMYDAGMLPALQAQEQQQDSQLQSLLAERSTMSAQAMDDMSRLQQQTLSDRTSIDAARIAVMSQQRFIEQDLARLQRDRENAKTLQAQYQRETANIDRLLQELGYDPQKKKTVHFP